jgi:hypothetical protein
MRFWYLIAMKTVAQQSHMKSSRPRFQLLLSRLSWRRLVSGKRATGNTEISHDRMILGMMLPMKMNLLFGYPLFAEIMNLKLLLGILTVRHFVD